MKNIKFSNSTGRGFEIYRYMDFTISKYKDETKYKIYRDFEKPSEFFKVLGYRKKLLEAKKFVEQIINNNIH